MFYSQTTGGFYDAAIHGSNIPGDCIEITEAEHSALLAGQADGLLITPDQNGNPVLSAPQIPAISNRKLKAQNAIDTAAGNARQRFVSAGTLIDMEYKLAQEQTAAWRTAGSPANAVPASITSWAAAANLTDEQAAADIEATAAAWETALTTIRQIRLTGKAAIDAATDQDTADDMAIVAQPYVEQLNAIGT